MYSMQIDGRMKRTLSEFVLINERGHVLDDSLIGRYLYLFARNFDSLFTASIIYPISLQHGDAK